MTIGDHPSGSDERVSMSQRHNEETCIFKWRIGVEDRERHELVGDNPWKNEVQECHLEDERKTNEEHKHVERIRATK